MSKAKVVVLSLLAAFAVSAIGSATATATTHNWKLEGTEIGKGEKEELKIDSQKVSTFATTVAKIKITIACSEMVGPSTTNIIEEGGKSKFEFQFKNCFVSETKEGRQIFLPACKVAEPFTLKGEGELKGAVGQPEDELKGTGGASPGSLEITGAECALKGTFKVEGHWFQDWIQFYEGWPPGIWFHHVWIEFWWQQVWFAKAGTEPIYGFSEIQATSATHGWTME